MARPVPSLVIDTHCHLTFPDFAGRIDDVLAEAEAHGVTGCVTISTTTRDCLDALQVAERHPRVWCSAGVHPLYSDQGPHTWANLGRVILSARCVAWGELGLDNHYPAPARDLQRAVLDEQLAYIKAHDRSGAAPAPPPRPKPIILHCREAFADLIPVLRASGLDAGRFVFHCFTGTPADMTAVLDFGAMVSFTGVVTYRNAREVQAAARLVPRDRLMVETDAPFLSPEPQRGEHPCRPAMVRHTLARLADVRGEALEDLHAAVNDNTRRFFGIA